MYELFPDKKAGDPFTVGHLNRLNKVARIVAAQHPGSFAFGQGGQSFTTPPFMQRPAIIVQEDFELGKAGGIDGVYEIRFRYFDHTDKPESTDEEDTSDQSDDTSERAINGTWKTDDTGHTSYLDSVESGRSFSEDDTLIVFWEQQRGMWLPCGTGSSLIIGKSIDQISKGSAGQCQVWDGPAYGTLSNTGDTLIGYARLGTVKARKWVYLLKYKDWYEVVNAEC